MVAFGRFVAALGVVGVVGGAPATAAAELEWNTGLLAGACGVGEHGAPWERSRVCLGARGDVLGGRSRPGGFAGGGFVATTTAGFQDLRLEGGGALLVPLGRAWTTILSSGPLLAERGGAWEPGWAGWAFVGSRRYNYHGSYSMAWGFVGGFEQGLGDVGGSTITLGVQIDGVVLAVPVLVVSQAARRHRR